MRLEPDKSPTPIALISFQFHKGAIRTAATVQGQAALMQFQFHKGAIRTLF